MFSISLTVELEPKAILTGKKNWKTKKTGHGSCRDTEQASN